MESAREFLEGAEPEAVRTTGGEAEEEVGAWRLLVDLLEYKWAALVVALAVFGAMAFWTMSQPRIYRAHVVLEYDPSPARPLGAAMEDPGQPALGSYWSIREWYATQNQILVSRALAERVVRKLGLHHDPDFLEVPEARRADWNGVAVEEAAKRLQRRLRVEPFEDARLVRLMVEDTRPERAQLVANTLADIYVEKSIEDRLSSTATALRWLSEQLTEFRKKLAESELALHAFKKENNVLSVGLEDRQNIIARNIERYSEALAEAKARRIALSARLAELQDANEADPMEVHATVIDENPRVQALRLAYQKKEQELAALGVRYGEAHPAVQSARQELETLQKQLRAEIDGIIASVERDLAEVRRTVAGLQRELNDLQEAGLRLNRLEIEYRRLVRERENNEKIYQVVLSRTTETDMVRALSVAYVRVLDRALKPEAPVKPRVVLNLAAGGVAGVLLGLAFALLLSRMDRRLRDVRDVERHGITVLGAVPRVDPEEFGVEPLPRRRRHGKLAKPVARGNLDVMVHVQPKGVAAEAVRTIRTNIVFMAVDRPLGSLLVTSPSPDEGKTTMTVNLAIAMAQSGKRVVVVDTDMRRSRVHLVFGLSNDQGVSTLLVGESDLDQVIQPTHIDGLSVVTAGPLPPNPSELLHSGGFREFVDALKDRFDMVIFDSPPINVVTDAAVVAAQVDGVVVVALAQKTTRDALRTALRRLREVGSRIVGAIFNGVDRSKGSYGYGGYYRYGYYTSQEEEHEEQESSSSAA